MAYFLFKLIPPRPSFPMDMSDHERAVMQAHVGYWTELNRQKVALLFGPVADPKGAWGVGVITAENDEAVHDLTANDPAYKAGIGFQYEVYPMPQVVY